jgi:Skp family chaperone for outer membrane proteins
MHKYIVVLLGLICLAAPAAGAQAPAAGEAPQQAPTAAPAAAPARGGLTIGWVDLERIVQTSAEGKIASAKVQALTQKKSGELGEKNKQLQGAQQKLQAGGTVLNDSARAQLEREIDRLNVDLQRMQQDAQQELQELQQELQAEFMKKLSPIIERVVKERNISFLFSRVEAGIVFADPALDLTEDLIKRFDATAGSAPPPATTAKPTAPAPAPKPPAIPPATPAPGTPPKP